MFSSAYSATGTTPPWRVARPTARRGFIMNAYVISQEGFFRDGCRVYQARPALQVMQFTKTPQVYPSHWFQVTGFIDQRLRTPVAPTCMLIMGSPIFPSRSTSSGWTLVAVWCCHLWEHSFLASWVVMPSASGHAARANLIPYTAIYQEVSKKVLEKRGI